MEIKRVSMKFEKQIEVLPFNLRRSPHLFPMKILGENAPCERQVSPDKLYRAALLRSRFADTILKAREKALDQVCCKSKIFSSYLVNL